MEGIKFEQPKSPAELEWEDKLKEIETWIDGEGRGLDPGIKETVAGFNLNGISTSQSCEGHADRTGGQRPWPWVEISALNEPPERFVGEGQIFEEAARVHGVSLEQLKKGIPEDVYWEARKKAVENDETPEYKEWEKKNALLREKAAFLLQEFYRDRQVPENIELVIDAGESGEFEIHSRENLTNKFVSRELNESELDALIKKLPERQAEMSAFAQFLKKRHFEGDRESLESGKNSLEALESSSIGTLNKFDLAQLLLGLREAVQLGDYDVIESDEHRKKLEIETGEEYRTISELLNKLELPFHGEPPKEDNGIYGFSLLIGKDEENLAKVIKADITKNDKEFGALMGYPKTAVDAYRTGNAFDLRAELSGAELGKLEQEEVLAFLEFMPSKQHWQEELDYVRAMQKTLKEKSPRLYHEIIEWRKKESRENGSDVS